MARWEDALDWQVEAYKFWRSAHGAVFAEGFERHVAASRFLSGGGTHETAVSLHADLANRAASLLYGAEPIWVEDDMMTLAEAAAESFQPEPLHETDLPTPNGFLCLPRPLVSTDIHGEVISWRAVAWRVLPVQRRSTTGDTLTGGRAVLLHFYHGRGDPDSAAEAMPGFREMERASGMPTLSLLHVNFWLLGEPYFISDGADDNVPPGVEPEHWSGAMSAADREGRLLGALLRLMAQTISSVSRHPAPRAFRKRAAVLQGDGHVVVVTLRKRRADGYPAEKGDTPVPWTHRWLVSGHWRQQPYPSLGITRQIWIGAYTKGPEDLPLVIRGHRVFRLAH